MYAAVLIVHVVSGTVGLLLGPVVAIQDRRRFASDCGGGGRWSAIYIAVVVIICISASALVWLKRTDLWWLVPVSAATLGLATLARAAAARRFRGWTHAYVHGLGGSYIALVTALIVVALTTDESLRGPAQLIPWLTPTVVGTVAIEVWRRRQFDTIRSTPFSRAARATSTVERQQD